MEGTTTQEHLYQICYSITKMTLLFHHKDDIAVGMETLKQNISFGLVKKNNVQGNES